MKTADGFILKNPVGEYVLMPTGGQIKNFRSIVLMNNMTAFVWNQLKAGASRQELLDAVLSEYEVDEATASKDLSILLEKMLDLGIIEE